MRRARLALLDVFVRGRVTTAAVAAKNIFAALLPSNGASNPTSPLVRLHPITLGEKQRH